MWQLVSCFYPKLFWDIRQSSLAERKREIDIKMTNTSWEQTQEESDLCAFITTLPLNQETISTVCQHHSSNGCLSKICAEVQKESVLTCGCVAKTTGVVVGWEQGCSLIDVYWELPRVQCEVWRRMKEVKMQRLFEHDESFS